MRPERGPPSRPSRRTHVRVEPGAKPFVDDLLLGRGFVRSRAAPSLRSIESQPSTQGFVFLSRSLFPHHPKAWGNRGRGRSARADARRGLHLSRMDAWLAGWRAGARGRARSGSGGGGRWRYPRSAGGRPRSLSARLPTAGSSVLSSASSGGAPRLRGGAFRSFSFAPPPHHPGLGQAAGVGVRRGGEAAAASARDGGSRARASAHARLTYGAGDDVIGVGGGGGRII